MKLLMQKNPRILQTMITNGIQSTIFDEPLLHEMIIKMDDIIKENNCNIC